jgi:hypothetical protein
VKWTERQRRNATVAGAAGALNADGSYQRVALPGNTCLDASDA